MRFSILSPVAALVLVAATARAQDTTLTRLLVANRHTVSIENGKLAGTGGRLLAEAALRARYTMLGEEHGVAEVPGLMRALMDELRPAGYNTFVIEVSPLQAQRLDAMARRPGMRTALDSMLASWYTTIPFYTLAEERALLESAMQPLGTSPAMRIWGLDYDISADRYYLAELESLAPATGKAAIRRARDLAQRGFENVLKLGNPAGLFAWSAPDSVFGALREAFGGKLPPRAREIIDAFERTARINRLFLGGDGYASNRMRSAYIRENFAKYLAAAPRSGAAQPRAVFKFGGSHVMRGWNYTNTLDVGTAATIDAESRGESAYHVLFLGGPGRQTGRMNILKMQYEPTAGGEVSQSNTSWLLDALPATGTVMFDLKPVREAYVRRPNRLTPVQDRFLHAYDAIVVVTNSTAGRALPLAIR